MTALRSDIDPDGLLEYSVVFTDRSLNHMSGAFQGVMRDISEMLREVYAADAVAVVPGGGTYAMEAVARQLATEARVRVIRNGWFSYRWSQIFEMGGIPADEVVMSARRAGNDPQAPFAPAPLAAVIARLRAASPGSEVTRRDLANGVPLPEEAGDDLQGAARRGGMEPDDIDEIAAPMA